MSWSIGYMKCKKCGARLEQEITTGIIMCVNCLEKESKGSYYLALNHNIEGWSLDEYSSIEEIAIEIQKGNTYGNPFKILKEIPFQIKLDIKDELK